MEALWNQTIETASSLNNKSQKINGDLVITFLKRALWTVIAIIDIAVVLDLVFNQGRGFITVLLMLTGGY